MEVFAHLAELFFELLTTQADRAPVPTIASGKFIHLYGDVLHIAICCKVIFKAWKPLIEKNFIFRLQPNYKRYNPKKFMISQKNTKIKFPSTTTHLFFLTEIQASTILQGNSFCNITHLTAVKVNFGYFPNSITHLTLDIFTGGILPPKLIYFKVGRIGDRVSLPPFLTYLKIYSHISYHCSCPPLPAGLKTLKLKFHVNFWNIKEFPPGLTTLSLVNIPSHISIPPSCVVNPSKVNRNVLTISDAIRANVVHDFIRQQRIKIA